MRSLKNLRLFTGGMHVFLLVWFGQLVSLINVSSMEYDRDKTGDYWAEYLSWQRKRTSAERV
ncbi:hypothetical protein QT990_35580 [Microcoleus sp. T3_B1]|uniref:hypothetical protein n=1 Tax=Microcoleus sp. T3_B1 TaxID=3055425 RepID=UPI002FD0FF43